MTGKIDAQFEELLETLQTAEKRHKSVYESASENHDWEVVDRELAIILKITNWRRTLNSLRSEVVTSGVVTDIVSRETAGTVNIHVKRRDIGEHVVKVSTELTPILTFPDGKTTISARADGDSIAFCSVVNGTANREKRIPIQYLTELSTRESFERIHVIPVQTSADASEQMDFMAFTAWIEPQQAAERMIIPEPEKHTGRTKPAKFTLLGKDYEVKAWNDMYVKVCEVMLLHRPYIMAAMDKDSEFNTGGRTNFSYLRSEIKYDEKRLSNGLWIETNRSSSELLDSCCRILEKCGFSPDALHVEMMEVR
ncbi:MAG: hypothetical protein LBG12_03960 [Synergistaceae bacterium]|jgi:hypothetical protein|nr:hypothetical protein [Synergistaceae bacterium]